MIRVVATILFTLAAGTVTAQQTADGRSFSRIDVQGNDRFRDGDIIATSGLQTGEIYTEDDLIVAVENLEFTGEFRDVRIFSQGDLLTIAVREEPEFTGALSFGLGYESDTGIFGTVGLRVDDALGNGSAIRARLTHSQDYTTATASLSNASFWGDGRAGGVRANFGDYRYDTVPFEYQTLSVSPFLNLDFDGPAKGEARVSALRSEIRAVDPDASPIIAAEAGERFGFGPGFSYLTGSAPEAPRGWALRFDQDVFFGDATVSRTEVNLSGRMPFIAGTQLRSRLQAGAIVALSGGTTAAERFTLGGQSMRGFARGGISPSDVCLGCGGAGEDLVTDLGGNYFAVLRSEVALPISNEGPAIEPFLFADVGTAWNVDTDTAPAGTLDDDAVLRSSAGLGISVGTPLGRFSATYAPFIDAAEFDEVAEFSLFFSSEF